MQVAGIPFSEKRQSVVTDARLFIQDQGRFKPEPSRHSNER